MITDAFPKLGKASVVVLFLALGFLSAGRGAAVMAGVVRSPEGTTGPREGPTVLADVPVTAMDQGVGVANNSAVAVADPTDPEFVVIANRKDAPDFGCAMQVSGDGGRRWVSVEAVPELPETVEKCYAPEIGFDGEGVLYYLFVGLAGAGNEPRGVFLTTSPDRGATFSRPWQVLGPRNFGVRMAIDSRRGEQGRIHLVWLHARSDPPLGGFGPPPNPILAAYSDDGGQTFSEPVQVSDQERELVVAPTLAVGQEGLVHIAYYDLEEDLRDYKGLEGPVWEGTWSLVSTSSSDAGVSFGSGVVVDDSVVPSDRVMLIFTMPPAVLAAGAGQLCAAWSDARNGDSDAFVRCSEDDGHTWGAARRLNDDPMRNGRTQYLPRMSISPDGRIDAIFYDRRHSPQDLANETYFTFSTDGGASYAPNVVISSDPSNSLIGQQYGVVSALGQVEFGSRVALLSDRSSTLAVWTDTRNSRPQTTGQDLFATQIIFPTERSVSVAAGGLTGAFLLVAGSAAFWIAARCWRRWRSSGVTSR